MLDYTRAHHCHNNCPCARFGKSSWCAGATSDDETVDEIIARVSLPQKRRLVEPTNKPQGHERGPLPDIDAMTLQLFLTKCSDEYELFKAQVIKPLMDQIKVRKPYMRTRDSFYDRGEEIFPAAVPNIPQQEGMNEDLGSDGEDPGYFRRDEFNPITKRTNQKFICKYCGFALTKLYNAKDHVHMHRGECPYACKYCDKAFSSLANRNRHQDKVCAKRCQRHRKLKQKCNCDKNYE